ncbi:MAG: RidA family protein [Chlorobium sp.]|uniref:RidA family protein n=1 Tax=Chlorobium sp. TaxID=1095 RepID=UPI0025BF2148|nr:RidA family protein [Chlorobium sp.]MCF8215968.1 RidA family protein [Chlorobium sp.]MCF8270477.1 RidA family protein [Chlorobium sp.]MCF8287243.1 RidA family protein [Chlorobium sp.]MCF8290445.1 RidA family protein [Chlorobium sp.]MCF8384679.1 RidA family protein [Chlorobium sp.]
MVHMTDVKKQAKDILEETLDREAVIVLARISEEMQLLLQAHPEPGHHDVERIITGYFLEKGKNEEFIEDWINTSLEYGRTRGLSGSDLTRAMLSDLGVFRFMSFLKDKGLTDEQITIVLTGAVQQAVSGGNGIA